MPEKKHESFCTYLINTITMNIQLQPTIICRGLSSLLDILQKLPENHIEQHNNAKYLSVQIYNQVVIITALYYLYENNDQETLNIRQLCEQARKQHSIFATKTIYARIRNAIFHPIYSMKENPPVTFLTWSIIACFFIAIKRVYDEDKRIEFDEEYGYLKEKDE